MSMQMPIRDGYSATHAIRTEAPWKDIPEVRGVPIVAMTASAIQGDKEKCQLAGMDVRLGRDPFHDEMMLMKTIGLSSQACERQSLGKGQVTQPHTHVSADLCQMLVKWAIEGRRKTAKANLSPKVGDRHGGASTSAPFSTANPSRKHRPQNAGSPVEPETTAQALTTKLDRLNFENDAALARSSESDGDRAMRRIQAEERDTMLRDDKLLSLTGPDMIRHKSHQDTREAESSMPLTEENIEKLVHGQDGDSSSGVRKQPSDADSNIVNPTDSVINNRLAKVLSQPSLSDKRQRDSEQTVTRGE
jgi:CheY-like chemotaxis protein